MKPLTKNELRFMKETGWTPTVEQGNEWDRTIWMDESFKSRYKELPYEDKHKEAIKYLSLAEEYAEKEYNIDLCDLYKKCTDECDGITLENDATYLFYMFFTKEELETFTDKTAIEWLKDFKYFSGYRKWDYNCIQYVKEAIEVYEGKRVFYLEDDGSIWNISHDEYPNSWVWEHQDRIVDPLDF